MMLHVKNFEADDRLRGGASAQDRGDINLSHYWTVLKCDRYLIGTITAVVLALMLLYVLFATPLYTASGAILIDIRKNQLLQNSQVVSDTQLDAAGAAIESQVELLRSESVALAVIRELKLVDDPIFNQKSFISSIIGSLTSLISTPDDPAYQRERAVVEMFDRNLKVRRSGLTYIINVDFTSPSAKRSAEIVNALADAYMANELDARYETTRRASRWLQDRIKDLREQASVADQKVQTFRSENNIVDTSRGRLSEQQLGDVNSQLATARASTAEARAKLDRVTEVAKSDVPDATVTDALRSEVVTRLRAQYLDISARYADLSSRYGANHSAAVNLRNQMTEIRRSMSDELRRIAETFKSDYEIARARETSLQSSLNALVDQAGVSGQAQVQLRDLESSAQTARNLYDSFLQRSLEATQQQTLPVSEARLITTAAVPVEKSWPKAKFMLPGALVLGLMLGVAAALVRDRFNDAFLTGEDIEGHLGAKHLGTLPQVTVPARPVTRLPEWDKASGAPRPFVYRDPMMRIATATPFSRFTETLHSVKVAVDVMNLTRKVRTIGVVSALPNEGKTTVAANLAAFIAQSGSRVLLIDGDLRNPRLTAGIEGGVEAGLLEVLTGSLSLSKVIRAEAETGVHLVPVMRAKRVAYTAELIASSAMAALLEAAGEHYNYVIIDLPPVSPVVDVRAVAHLVDGFVCVTEWGQTSRRAVTEALASVESLQERLIGVVLNKADPDSLKNIESYKGKYFNSYYSDGMAAQPGTSSP